MHGASLARINRELERHAARGWTEEAALENLRIQIKAQPGPKGPAYWLTLARLGELALWWTGLLADAGEYQAVGDLLLNPRRKLLYIRNQSAPLPIKRHQAITRQVAPLVPAGRSAVDWLKYETFLFIDGGPVLPELLNDLSRWPDYGADPRARFQRRMDRIARSLCLIRTLNLPEGVSLRQHLAGLPKEQAKEFTQHLCNFDLAYFDSLAKDLAPLIFTTGNGEAGEGGCYSRCASN